ncbi:MAG: hypothetical protein WB471_05950 [Nocardioides sp.]
MLGLNDVTAVPRTGVRDPLPDGLERLLRQAVLGHITTEHRRAYAPVIHAGLPGRSVASLSWDGHRIDHALRTDALEALLRGQRRTAAAGAPGAWSQPFVWLTRRGTLELQDMDLLWSAAARSAADELGRAVLMVVVTRQGWCDPRSGTHRTWRRLRPPRR